MLTCGYKDKCFESSLDAWKSGNRRLFSEVCDSVVTGGWLGFHTRHDFPPIPPALEAFKWTLLEVSHQVHRSPIQLI